jgi:hypothetical protein
VTAAPARGGSVEVRWTPAAERGVTGYVVSWGAGRVAVKEPRATLRDVPAGAAIGVKAVTEGGLEGWDWARPEASEAAGRNQGGR